MIDFKRLVASIVKIFHLTWWLGSIFNKGPAVSDSFVFNIPNIRLRSAARGIVTRFWDDPRGAVAVEYGLILAGVFLTMVGGLYMFGDKLEEMLNKVASTIGAVLM